jgi:uncharacterized protein (DUF1015 family)
MAVAIPKILLPDGVDMTAWASVACDQFTSEKEYWDKLEKFVGTKPSTLKLVLPEVYLKDNFENRIKNINANMEKYLDSGIFKDELESFILVERSTPYQKRRLGLMIAVDLEEYSYEKGSKSRIRATEGTIIERLPPRVKIREKAALEFPHIMLLIDDKDKTIIEPLFERHNELEKLYDFELNMGGGHIKGYKADDSKKIKEDILKLLNKDTLIKKYGRTEEFLFAVGDGNHSLATAKNCWENLKITLTDEQKINHPARFALCELVNLYDDGLCFEPIHRFVEGVDPEKFIKNLPESGKDSAGILIAGNKLPYWVSFDIALAVKTVDDYISKYIAENGGTVDYIHGETSLKALTEKNSKSVGIILPKMNKETLFLSVMDNGSLPKKTFSMGEAQEKRYYIEGKKII